MKTHHMRLSPITHPMCLNIGLHRKIYANTQIRRDPAQSRDYESQFVSQ